LPQDWKKLYTEPPVPSCDDGLEYSATALDHFRSPRNQGRLDGYHGKGSVGDPAGEYLEITIRLSENDLIEGIGLLVSGCVGSVACGSALTELVAQAPLKQAAAIGPGGLLEALSGLPKQKHHCVIKALTAFRLAVCDALQGREMIEAGHVPGFDEYRRLRREGSIAPAVEVGGEDQA
jgi:nitrogen fixation protein NifU and related proteins